MNSYVTNHTAQSPSATAKANLNGIDLVKFICAILVFMIHCVPFKGQISPIADNINTYSMNCLCRVAVPFYFVCSGYFLFRKMPLYELNVDTIKHYCYKILRLTAAWTLLLSPLGATEQLWYLTATVVAVVLLSLLLHFRAKLGIIWLLACLLYAFGLFGDSYHGVIAPLTEISIVSMMQSVYIRLFGSTRNGVFMGFIFVLLGATLSQRKLRMKPLTAAIGLCLSLAALLIETIVLEHFRIPIEYNMFISLVPAAYFLFCLAYSAPLKDHSAYRCLRNTGMLFYFIHLFILRVFYLFIRGLNNPFNFGILNPLFVFSFPTTLFAAFFLNWLSGKEKFKWINWLLT